MKGYFKDTSPYFQLIFGAFITVIVFFILFVIGIFVAIPLFGIGMNELSSSLQMRPENIHIIKFFQSIQSIGVFVIPPFFIALLFSQNIKEYLSFDRVPAFSSFILAAFSVILALPFINFLVEINLMMHLPTWLSEIEQWMLNSESQAQKLLVLFMDVDTLPALLVNLFIMAVIPAIGEELLFRSFLQKTLTRWTRNTHWGVWIAAFIFSAFHLQFYGFLARLFLGVLFGYLLVWSSSIWLPILAHFVNNAMAVIAFYYTNGNAQSDTETIGTSDNLLIFTFIGLVLLAFSMYLLRKNEQKKELSS